MLKEPQDPVYEPLLYSGLGTSRPCICSAFRKGNSVHRDASVEAVDSRLRFRFGNQWADLAAEGDGLAAAAGGGVFFATLAAGDVEEAPGIFVFFQEAFAGDDAAVAAAGSVG